MISLKTTVSNPILGTAFGAQRGSVYSLVSGWISGSLPRFSFPSGLHLLTHLVVWWEDSQKLQLLSQGRKKNCKKTKKVEEIRFIEEAKANDRLGLFSAALARRQRDR